MDIQKPAHGKPCNNCGLCCKDQLCVLGQVHFKMKNGPCPALKEVMEGYHCGLAVSPQRYIGRTLSFQEWLQLSEGAKVLVGAGIGCDAQLEGEPYDQSMKTRMTEYLTKNDDAVQKAKIVWRIGA